MKFRLLEKNTNELNEYHRMRYALWPHHTEEELKEEMIKIVKGEGFYKHELSWTVFVVERENGKLGGFAEITLYPDLSFCDSKPVGFIEGWYIDEDLRRKGIGRAFIKFVEKWLLNKGCIEIASDVEEHNKISQVAHESMGFIKLHKEDDCIFYKKKL